MTDHLEEANRCLQTAKNIGEKNWAEYSRFIEQAKLEVSIDTAESLRNMLLGISNITGGLHFVTEQLNNLNSKLDQVLEEARNAAT